MKRNFDKWIPVLCIVVFVVLIPLSIYLRALELKLNLWLIGR